MQPLQVEIASMVGLTELPQDEPVGMEARPFVELEGEIDLRVLVLRHWWRGNGPVVNEILDLMLEL